MSDPQPLDCQKCPGFCCKMAGYVQVSAWDIRRLAKYLGLTVRAFEARHIVKVTRSGKKRIKAGYEPCQFLDAERRCTVYPARPKDCRGYVCWDQDDTTIYDFARFFQRPLAEQREAEKEPGKAKTGGGRTRRRPPA